VFGVQKKAIRGDESAESLGLLRNPKIPLRAFPPPPVYTTKATPDPSLPLFYLFFVS